MPVSAQIKFTPHGRSVRLRISATITGRLTGGSGVAPMIPRPPVLLTAAASGGYATKAMPAPTNGCTRPYSVVNLVAMVDSLQIQCTERQSSRRCWSSSGVTGTTATG